jgi:hypothetical protein
VLGGLSPPAKRIPHAKRRVPQKEGVLRRELQMLLNDPSETQGSGDQKTSAPAAVVKPDRAGAKKAFSRLMNLSTPTLVALL